MRLVAHFRTVTPVFCAGADPNGPSEIREFAIKGMLRWFYRALDGHSSRDAEARIFGASAGAGIASPLVLRVEPRVIGHQSYRNDLKSRRGEDPPGACYLGYSLYLGDNNRLAIPPDKGFDVRITPRWSPPSEEVRRAWLASLWLLGHLGGIGSRMRRGFGTIALVGLEGDWPEVNALPMAHGATNPQEWNRWFNEGYRTIREWFPVAHSSNDHRPVLPRLLDVLIGPGFPTWIKALNHIGTEMKMFRLSNPSRPRGEYPDNAAFGLPLRAGPSAMIVPTDPALNRSPSRLWVRVLHIAGQSHPMVWLQHGSLLPRGGLQRESGRGTPSRLPAPPGLGRLRAFLDHLRGRRYQ